MRRPLIGLMLAAMLGLGLAGCSGDDGAQGPPGAQGPAGPQGPPGTNAGDTVVLAQLTPEQWAGLQMKAEVTGVAISSPPVVKFKVTDQNGRPVVGLENNTTKSSTATLTSNANVRFELAKLIPGKDGGNSEWISYLVTTVPVTTATASTGCPANTSCAWRPDTDQTGTLVGAGDGTYTYTFWRDVTKIKADVAAWAAAQTPPKDISALGDLTFDPSLQHRLIIQISGAARGTGSNTANAQTVTPAVNLENVVNAVFDFIPATGAKIPPADLLKDVVDISSCNACHQKLAFHGGGRTDVAYCTTCHTSQRAYGWSNTASTDGRFPNLTETKTTNAVTGIVSYSYAPDMGIADGEVVGSFTTLIHKIHQGGSLSKVNYEYANVAFNLKNFSMLNGGQRMCTVCHDPAVATKAALAYQQPTRKACGACHDNVNWTTGENHVGRAQADDKACVLCHSENQTKIDHRMPYLTPNNPVIADGLVSFTYEIKEAKVNASNDLTIEFRILQQTSPSATKTPITLKAAANCVADPLAGFTGGPSFLLAYAMSQDGVTTPADYNNLGRSQAQPRSISLANLLTTGATVVAPCTGTTPPNPGGVNGTLAASSTAGYYIATIPASGAWEFPSAAKMRAVALQGYFTQTGVDAALAGRHTVSVIKPVIGSDGRTDTVRRTVADSAKCAKCHEYFEGHGGNRVYEVQVCVTCHVPGLATSGRGIADATLQAWPFTSAEKKLLGEWGMMTTSGCGILGCTTGSFIDTTETALNFPVTSNNMKDMIHGIHSGRERAKPFQDARDRTPGAINLLDFRRMDFPGLRNNCEGCHVTATAATTTYNSLPVGVLASTYESIDAAYAAAIAAGTATTALAKTALATANNDDAIVTPFAASCSSCHDGAVAKSHMDINGAKIGVKRLNWASGEVESCAVCHGPGSEFDAARMHR